METETEEVPPGHRNVHFTQFLRPRGEKLDVWIARPEAIAKKADELIARGYRLEAEVLLTGAASFDCCGPSLEDPEEDVSLHMEIVSNGPETVAAVDRLIETCWQLVFGGVS